MPPAGITSVHILQVMFAVRTDNTEDLEYLEELLQKHPDTYRKISTSTLYRAHTQSLTWRQSYSALPRDHVCIKIDDDIVYIQVRQHTTVYEVTQMFCKSSGISWCIACPGMAECCCCHRHYCTTRHQKGPTQRVETRVRGWF